MSKAATADMTLKNMPALAGILADNSGRSTTSYKT